MLFDGLKIQTSHDKLSAEEKACKKAYYDDRRVEKARDDERKKKPRKYRQRDFSWKILAGITSPAEKLSAYVRYSDLDKKARISFNNAETFLSPYVDFNLLKKVGKKQYIRSAFMSMMFDIDSNVSVQQLSDVLNGFQFSYITGRQLQNGVYERPHLLIWLKYPVFVNPQEDKPSEVQARQRADFRRFEAIEAYIIEKLKAADIKIDGGQKTFTKNPDSDAWDGIKLHDGCRTLKEIEDALGDDFRASTSLSRGSGNIQGSTKWMTFSPKFNLKLPAKLQPKKPANNFRATHIDENSRTLTIFNSIRFLAYKYARENPRADAQQISDYLKPFAEQINGGFTVQLKPYDIRSIINSIGRYCRSKDFLNWNGNKNRGSAKEIIFVSDSLKARQEKGAIYTHYLQSKSNFEAVKTYRAGNPEATKADARVALRLSKNTVAKYWNVEDISEVQAFVRYMELKKAVSELHASLDNQRISIAVRANNDAGQYGVIREMVYQKQNHRDKGTIENISDESNDKESEYYALLSEYDYLNTYMERESYKYIRNGSRILAIFDESLEDHAERAANKDLCEGERLEAS